MIMRKFLPTLLFSIVLCSCTSIYEKKSSIKMAIKQDDLRQCGSIANVFESATYTATISCKWD